MALPSTTNQTDSRIVAAIDGNLFNASAKLVTTDDRTIPCEIEIGATLTYDFSDQRLPGSNTIGEVVGDIQVVDNKFKSIADHAIEQPDIPERVRRFVLSTDAFRSKSFNNSSFLQFDESFSIIEICRSCNGTAQVTCRSCGGSRNKICGSCYGSGKITNRTQVYDQQNQRYQTQEHRVQCLTCAGSGRVTCTICHGRGTLRCEPCAASGRFTRVFRGGLQLAGRRSLSYAATHGTGAIPVTVKAGHQAVLAAGVINVQPGDFKQVSKTEFTFFANCTFEFRETKTVIGAREFFVRFLGPPLGIVTADPVLDHLHAPMVADLEMLPEDSGEQLVKIMSASKLGRTALAAAVNKNSPADFTVFRPFATSSLTDRLTSLAGQNFKGVGRSFQRQFWRLFTLAAVVLPPIALSAAAQLTPTKLAFPDDLFFLDGVMALLLVFAAWMYAVHYCQVRQRKLIDQIFSGFGSVKIVLSLDRFVSLAIFFVTVAGSFLAFSDQLFSENSLFNRIRTLLVGA